MHSSPPHRSPPSASFSNNVPYLATLSMFGIKVTRKISLASQFDFPTELSGELRDSHLSNVSNSLIGIFSHDTLVDRPPFSMEMLYRSVEMLVKYNYGKLLYELVEKNIKEYCDGYILNFISKSIDEGQDFAKTVLSAWIQLEEKLTIVHATFAYLFEVWVLKQPQLICLDALAAGFFRHRVLADKYIELIKAIEAKLGPGMPRNDSTVVKMLSMIQQINLMPFVMENLAKSIDQINLDFYHFSKVYSTYEDLANGFTQLLPIENRSEYIVSLRDNFLSKSKISSGDHLKSLIERQNFTEFEACVKIAQICESLPIFSSSLKIALSQIVRETFYDPNILEGLDRPISLFMSIKSLLTDWFGQCILNDEQVGLSASFESALNQNGELGAELLCCYCDVLIRGYRSNISELASANRELDEGKTRNVYSLKIVKKESQLVDQIIEIFRLLHSKDHFEHVYKRMLARRLLDFSSKTNLTLEQILVNLFEQEMGSAFTSKMQGMIKDSSNQDNFITCGIWPSLENNGDEIPGLELSSEPIKKYLEQRKLQYLASHPGRLISWLNTLSTCEVEVSYPSSTTKGRSRVRFLVSLPQAAVLYLFNGKDQFSLDEIRTETNIRNKDFLSRVMKTLSSSKLPILIFENDSKSYSFNYNLKLPSSLAKDENKTTTIKVLLYSRKELLASDTRHLFKTLSELQEQQQSPSPILPTIDLDSSLMGYQLEAAIVRTLKKNKIMNTLVLKEAVKNSLTWRFSEQQWNDHLTSLGEREYFSTDSSTGELKYIP